MANGPKFIIHFPVCDSHKSNTSGWYSLRPKHCFCLHPILDQHTGWSSESHICTRWRPSKLRPPQMGGVHTRALGEAKTQLRAFMPAASQTHQINIHQIILTNQYFNQYSPKCLPLRKHSEKIFIHIRARWINFGKCYRDTNILATTHHCCLTSTLEKQRDEWDERGSEGRVRG